MYCTILAKDTAKSEQHLRNNSLQAIKVNLSMFAGLLQSTLGTYWNHPIGQVTISGHLHSTKDC